MFEEAHVLPLKSGGFWVCGRTSQGYVGASSTRDPTAHGGWTTTGVATYWDNRLAPQKILPLPGRKLPGCATGTCMATGLKHPRGPLTPKRMANGDTIRCSCTVAWVVCSFGCIFCWTKLTDFRHTLADV